MPLGLFDRNTTKKTAIPPEKKLIAESWLGRTSLKLFFNDDHEQSEQLPPK